MAILIDTEGHYHINKLLNKPLYWSTKLKTCCYSTSGMDSCGYYKAYGDYIASTLPIYNTRIPYLSKNNKIKFYQSF